MKYNASSQVADILKKEFGSGIAVTDSVPASCHTDWSGSSPCIPLCHVRPATSREVSRILELCNNYGVPVIPQGGMTGLVGGAVPTEGSIALSLERLNGYIKVDPDAATAIVSAGVTLADVQDAALDSGLRYPIDLPSRETCQIGGTIATNAGGEGVVRYGMTRDQVLGLEVVTSDGRILKMMNNMKKNNAGYDLKHLFIGSEGTLGVVTQAVLKLAPPLNETQTFLCACRKYTDVISVLSRLKNSNLGIEAFEVMWKDFYSICGNWSNKPLPLNDEYSLYALCRIEGDKDSCLSILESAIDNDEVADAVYADSLQQVNHLWSIRESTSEFPTKLRPINFDISLPISIIGDFVLEVKNELDLHYPHMEKLFFGHIGDNNLHITIDKSNIISTEADDIEIKLERMIYEKVSFYHGSISAEHGIGLLKRDFMRCCVTQESMSIMSTIKHALDPNNILNPGKVIKT